MYGCTLGPPMAAMLEHHTLITQMVSHKHAPNIGRQPQKMRRPAVLTTSWQ